MTPHLGRRRTACLLAVGLFSLGAPAVAQPSLFPSGPLAQSADPFAGFVSEAARRFGLPEGWIRAVMHAESASVVSATSRKGAVGLMQVMPQTYAELRHELGLGADPYDPRDNILAGAAYLRAMYDRYGQTGMLAAYNAGPRRWEAHLAGVRALPAETDRYVARLAPGMVAPLLEAPASERTAPVRRSPAEAPIFVPASAIRSAVTSGEDPSPPNPLFIPATPSAARASR